MKSRSYNNQTQKRANSHRNFYLGAIFDYFMVVVSVVVALILLISYLSPYVNPNKWAIISILGLVAPLLYILNVGLVLYWVVRWKKFVFISLVAMVIGFGNVSLFYRPFVSKQYDTQTSDRHQLKLVTYNVQGFMKKRDGQYASTLGDDVEFIAGLSPDILCMQEFQTTKRAPRYMFDDRVPEMKQAVHNYRLRNAYGGWGLAIYTRYPIINSGVIEFEESTNSAMWADIKINKSDTIRLFNCHLQTTSINSVDMKYIENQEFMLSDGSQLEPTVRNIFGKLKRNYEIRAHQADTISMLVNDSPHPVVVCGDFNDTPMSYAYNTIRGDLQDAFVEKGRGLSTTFNGLFNMFRIDYVLHSPTFEVLSYDTPKHSPSDHNPVCVTLLPEKKPIKK